MKDELLERSPWITDSRALHVSGPLGETARILTAAVLELAEAGGALRAGMMLAGKEPTADTLEATGAVEGYEETQVLAAAVGQLVAENVTMARQLTETADEGAHGEPLIEAADLPDDDVPDAEFVRRLHEATVGTLTIEEPDGRWTTIEVVVEADDAAAIFHPEW